MEVGLREWDFNTSFFEGIEYSEIHLTAENFWCLDARPGPDPKFKIKRTAPEIRKNDIRRGSAEYQGGHQLPEEVPLLPPQGLNCRILPLEPKPSGYGRCGSS